MPCDAQTTQETEQATEVAPAETQPAKKVIIVRKPDKDSSVQVGEELEEHEESQDIVPAEPEIEEVETSEKEDMTEEKEVDQAGETKD